MATSSHTSSTAGCWFMEQEAEVGPHYHRELLLLASSSSQLTQDRLAHVSPALTAMCCDYRAGEASR